MSTVGDDVMAVLEVRGEHAVVSGEMGPEMDTGSWHRASSLRERHFRGGEETRRHVMDSPRIFGPTAAAARV